MITIVLSHILNRKFQTEHDMKITSRCNISMETIRLCLTYDTVKTSVYNRYYRILSQSFGVSSCKVAEENCIFETYLSGMPYFF